MTVAQICANSPESQNEKTKPHPHRLPQSPNSRQRGNQERLRLCTSSVFPSQQPEHNCHHGPPAHPLRQLWAPPGVHRTPPPPQLHNLKYLMFTLSTDLNNLLCFCLGRTIAPTILSWIPGVHLSKICEIQSFLFHLS